MIDRTHRCEKGGRGAHGVGTHSCYSLCTCRCWDCVRARSDYDAARHRANAQGRTLQVDAEPVRQHVASLMADRKRGATNGVGLKQIAKVSGVAHGTLWKLMYGAPDRDGPSKKVRRATAEKLLAVTSADMADGARVPAEGTRLRLTEMVEAGWAKTHLARHIGVAPSNFNGLLKRRWVTAGTARRVARVHAAWKTGELPTEGRRSRWEVARELA